MSEFDSVQSSGKKDTTQTGAVRDRRAGKGRYDLVTPIGMRRLARHYENGIKSGNYAPRNWEKGMPLSWFLDSMERHVEDIKMARIMGVPPKEDNVAAVAWNAFGFMHTEEMIAAGKLPAELDDLPNPRAATEGARCQLPPRGKEDRLPNGGYRKEESDAR